MIENICNNVNPFSEEATFVPRSADGSPVVERITVDDVAEVLHEASSGDMWDGTVAAVLRLHDGRFVAWETFYGPTGDGFNEDAYGGDADLTVGTTYDAVVRFGLTNEGRNLLNIPHPE